MKVTSFRDMLLMIIITILIVLMVQNTAQYTQIAEINDFVEQLTIIPETCP